MRSLASALLEVVRLGDRDAEAMNGQVASRTQRLQAGAQTALMQQQRRWAEEGKLETDGSPTR